MGLHQTIREEGLQQGLREAIELGLNLRFGDKGLQLMDRIRQIDDTDRLYMIKNAVLTAETIPEFQNIIEKRAFKGREH
jgi:hypothetical protein